MILKVVTFKDRDSSILFKKSKKIAKFDKELKNLVRNMKETMKKEEGIGLAAPQIGKGMSLCIVALDKRIEAFCNPKVVKSSKEKIKGEEGCLSFPGVFLKIKRSKEIEVEYCDVKGNKKKIKVEGLIARTLQHEIDHLSGIAFIDKL